MAIISIVRNDAPSFQISRSVSNLIKFFIAIGIALCHYSAYAISFAPNKLYDAIMILSSIAGVPLFFFFSGYGLMRSEQVKHLCLWKFIKRRLMKVYLPVVLVSFIWQLFLWPRGAGIDRIPHLLYATLWGFSDGILWFVKAIMICYILFRIYTFFLQVYPKVAIIVLLVGTIIVYTLVCWLFANWAAIGIPMFALGIIIADYNNYATKIIKSHWMILIVFLLTVLFVILYAFYGNIYLKALGNYYSISIILLMCANYSINIELPSWLGDISYDIYITHNKIINGLKSIYAYLGFGRFFIFSALAAILLYLIRKIIKI